VANNHIERIEKQRLGIGAVVLEKVERDAPAFVDGYNLAIQEGIGREPFTSAGDKWKLSGEEVTPTRPERYSAFVSARQAAVAVKLDFVAPFFALGDVLDRQCIHWLDEIDSGGVSSSCFHLGIV